MEEKNEKKNTTHQGKGKKKNKIQIDLNKFLSDDTTPAGFSAIPSSRCNWADIMNEDTDDFSSSWNKKNDNVVILPNAPKAIRGPDIDIGLVPTSPPYYCYLNNLPYEASANDVQKFFGKLKTLNIEFIKENTGGRMRNYVRVEFEDRDSLIDALSKNQSLMKNRYIKVAITSPENERENFRKERERTRDERDDRTSGDWRIRKPEDKPVGQFSSNRSYNNSYFNRNRDTNLRSNDFTGYNNRPYKEQEKYPEHLSQSNSNRKQYLNNFLRSISPPPANLVSSSNNSDENSSIQTRPKLQSDKPLNHSHQQDDNFYSDNEENLSNQNKDVSNESTGPIVRRKLVLLPPTKKETSENPNYKISSSIFGDAKPVDTNKRLLEVDEKTKQNEKDFEKLAIDDKTYKKDIDSNEFFSTRNSHKRGSDSGSQAGSSLRENFEEREKFDRSDERFNKYDDWANRNKNNNRDRRSGTGNRNYENSGYNRDHRNNGGRYNSGSGNINRNNNRNWNNENSDRNLTKKNYDEDRGINRGNNSRLNSNNKVSKPRNDGNYSMNKFDLLKEGEMA